MPELDRAKWLQEGKEKAPELRASATDAAKEMFASGDIQEFLDLLSRLNCYDAYNLMLILRQYPKAKFLASYNVWKRLLNNPRARILKPEWTGKGIDLVIPFMDGQTYSDHKLIWFTARQFDISQTNVSYELPSTVYILDSHHPEILVKSICETISMEYHRTVYHIGADAQMKAAGLPGRMSESTVSIRDDMKPYAKLNWLIDCLCSLQGDEENIQAEFKDLFRQCIKYTLWKVWSLDNPPSLYAYKRLIKGFAEEVQMDFLDYLRRVFRSLEESIAASYASCRAELETASGIKHLDEEIWFTDLKPPQ